MPLCRLLLLGLPGWTTGFMCVPVGGAVVVMHLHLRLQSVVSYAFLIWLFWGNRIVRETLRAHMLGNATLRVGLPGPQQTLHKVRIESGPWVTGWSVFKCKGCRQHCFDDLTTEVAHTASMREAGLCKHRFAIALTRRPWPEVLHHRLRTGRYLCPEWEIVYQPCARLRRGTSSSICSRWQTSALCSAV